MARLLRQLTILTFTAVTEAFVYPHCAAGVTLTSYEASLKMLLKDHTWISPLPQTRAQFPS